MPWLPRKVKMFRLLLLWQCDDVTIDNGSDNNDDYDDVDSDDNIL